MARADSNKNTAAASVDAAVCVRAGAYKEALEVFDEQEEMRKSLWKPRFTPVSFSLLLTAAAAESARNAGAIGDDHAQRLDYLPRVLNQMASYNKSAQRLPQQLWVSRAVFL